MYPPAFFTHSRAALARHSKKAVAAFLLGVVFHPAGLSAQTKPSAPKIIIKVDDLGAGGHDRIPPQWDRLANFVKEKKIKINAGIICESLEGEKPKYVQWIKEFQKTGLVEFWFHGYEHKDHTESDGITYPEMDGRPYEELKRRVDLSQKLAMEKLGFPLLTYGPPGGGKVPAGHPGSTEIYRVMQGDPYMKVWLYSHPMDEEGKKLEAQGKVTVLDRVWPVNIEQPLFKPNADALQKGYTQYAARRQYFVLQGHPGHWDDNGFAEFAKMIDFMTAQGCEFVKASEYAQSLKASSAPTR